MTKVDIKIYRILMVLIAIMATNETFAASDYYLSGIVRDAETLEPLPFASVQAKGLPYGTLTNEKGIFELTVPNDTKALLATCLGYDDREIQIRKNNINLYDIHLKPSATELKEVVVKRQKYSKKNNPAVEFAKRLKKIGETTDPENNPFYNYTKNELITLGLNDFGGNKENSWVFKKFPFLVDHIDTSEVSGKPILNLIAKERISDIHYRKDPKATKEIVIAERQDGVDEIVDQKSLQVFFDDAMPEIDLFSNDIALLQNRFVSPLSKIAPDYYKFYLTDTVEIDNERCIVLSFYPHNQATFGFNGQIFVPLNDSTMFIKKVVMRTPKNINLNFIENLYIAQDYKKAPDGSRLKSRDNLILEARVVSGTPGFYVKRDIKYDNQNFNEPDDQSIFDNLGQVIFDEDASNRDAAFWAAQRIIDISEKDTKIDQLMAKLHSVPLYYWSEKILKILFMGYIPLSKDDKFEYGPVNTTISGGPIEGLRLRVGGITTANLSKRWFGRGHVAYGTKDHKWKYNAEITYSFTDKQRHSREFPIKALQFTSEYDLDQLGQHYEYTNKDNVFLGLKRMNDYNAIYHQVNKLAYILELENNFSLRATLKNERLDATPYMPFVNGYGERWKHFWENSFQLELRYAPGEKYYQTTSFRLPINLEAPVFLVRQTVAPKGWFGSEYLINMTEASFQKRFWLSVAGYTDVIVKGGHVWSQTPYTNLLIPNANLSYTIQPETYSLMNPMEFINDSYASLDITYWPNGAILNNIPLLKKLKLREVVEFKALWGNLSHKNDPHYNLDLLQFPDRVDVTRMTHTPYMEISAGLVNIFKCIRLDYVWRLSYLDVPYRIDRNGLRLAMYMTF